jgi:hypothetical protein
MFRVFNRLSARKPPGAPASEPAPARFDALFACATRAAEARDFERAVDFLDAAIAADPARPEACYKRGNALRNLGRLRVISVDTSLAHLSGALGRPTWALIPYTRDWRWLRTRHDATRQSLVSAHEVIPAGEAR